MGGGGEVKESQRVESHYKGGVVWGKGGFVRDNCPVVVGCQCAAEIPKEELGGKTWVGSIIPRGGCPSNNFKGTRPKNPRVEWVHGGAGSRGKPRAWIFGKKTRVV